MNGTTWNPQQSPEQFKEMFLARSEIFTQVYQRWINSVNIMNITPPLARHPELQEKLNQIYEIYCQSIDQLRATLESCNTLHQCIRKQLLNTIDAQELSWIQRSHDEMDSALQTRLFQIIEHQLSLLPQIVPLMSQKDGKEFFDKVLAMRNQGVAAGF